MSYILTALQKSEQERREKDQEPRALITQANNIAAEPRAFKKHYLVGITLLLLTCLCALIVLIWQQSNTNLHPINTTTDSGNLAKQTASTSTKPEINDDAIAANTHVQTETPSKPKVNTEPESEKISAQPEENNRKQIAPLTTSDDARPLNNITAALPAKQPKAVVSKQSTAPTPRVEELYQDATEMPEEVMGEQTPAQQELSLRAQRLQRQLAQPKVPCIYELPKHIQNQLPKMVYSAHIYSSDADSGFAIINDRRRYRGDRITANLVLVSVENDAVILSFEGNTFSLGAMKNWPLE